MTATVIIKADGKAVDVRKWFGCGSDREESYHLLPGAELVLHVFADHQVTVQETDRQVKGQMNYGVGG